jgi:hypothetical protein
MQNAHCELSLKSVHFWIKHGKRFERHFKLINNNKLLINEPEAVRKPTKAYKE